VLRKLRDTLDSPIGRAIMAAAVELQSEKSEYPRAYFDRRMDQLDPMFDAAIARGELLPDVPREELFTNAAGPIYFRTFIAGRGVDDEYIDGIVEKICWFYCR
jgi:hypothetical protein